MEVKFAESLSDLMGPVESLADPLPKRKDWPQCDSCGFRKVSPYQVKGGKILDHHCGKCSAGIARVGYRKFLPDVTPVEIDSASFSEEKGQFDGEVTEELVLRFLEGNQELWGALYDKVEGAVFRSEALGK